MLADADINMTVSDVWTADDLVPAVIEPAGRTGVTTGNHESSRKPLHWWLYAHSHHRAEQQEDNGEEEASKNTARSLSDLEIAHLSSSKTGFFKEFSDRLIQRATIKEEIKSRVSFLKSEAEAECQSYSIASERDLWNFLNARPFPKKPH